TSPKPDNKKDSGQKSNDEYRIQFLTSSNVLSSGDKRLKGLRPVDHYTEKSLVKYTYGHYSSQAEANADLRKVRKSFPDAFVIHFKNGQRIK
ncbi:MAG: SPOR domain-containing protein, partial [Paramuribaculum sp.]|nr:SPOR domain-containing protein [Paramuribaculum sp.]